MKQLYQAENYLIYGHKDTANGKSILKLHNKQNRKKAQTGKENINTTDTN